MERMRQAKVSAAADLPAPEAELSVGSQHLHWPGSCGREGHLALPHAPNTLPETQARPGGRRAPR